MSESAANRLLPRTWMLSKHRHNPKELGCHVMHVRETKPHALSHANTETTEEQQEQARREREARAKFDELGELDRELLRLSLYRGAARERSMPFSASDRRRHEDAGWLFVKYESHGRIAIMVKSFVGAHTHAEIGERVHLSASQVRRRLNALDPAMVKFAEMRGWL